MSSTRKNKSRLVITLGDVGGIGPEVTLKALAAELDVDDARYVVVGDGELLTKLNRTLKVNLPLAPLDSGEGQARVSWYDPLPPALFRGRGENSPEDSRIEPLNQREPPPPSLSAAPSEGEGGRRPREGEVQGEGARTKAVLASEPGSAAHARAAVAWLKHGAELCLRGDANALVTAPVNKESIIRSGEKDFVGQTELLSALAKTDRTAMMLLGHDDRGRWLRVALATTHVPIARVAQSLTREKIERAIQLAAKACKDLGLPRARVGVCGLNPHAGEGGKIGTEELAIIAPAVEAAGGNGFDVVGPLPADTLFHYAFQGDYDAVVAMYHDQGLVPLKMIGFETGVNWTLGLPFIRTSPDHGTAYDIAGRGMANPSSMIAAIRLAKTLSARPNPEISHMP